MHNTGTNVNSITPVLIPSAIVRSPPAAAAAATSAALIEMDALGPRTRSSSRARAKLPAGPGPAPSAADRRNYALGIGLLFVVVVLWTASNFITQVRVSRTRVQHASRLPGRRRISSTRGTTNRSCACAH
jgi:hypothetical protein